MRLSKLSPRWIEKDGERIGLIFLCPHCLAQGVADPSPLTCYWKPLQKIGGDEADSQYGLLAKLKPSFGPPYDAIKISDVVPAKRGYAWEKSGDDFDTLTITPSLDCSASGHWHGFITAGETN